MISKHEIHFDKVFQEDAKALVGQILKIDGVVRAFIRGDPRRIGTKRCICEFSKAGAKDKVQELLSPLFERKVQMAEITTDKQQTDTTKQPTQRIDQFKEKMSGVADVMADMLADAEKTSSKIQSQLRDESQEQIAQMQAIGNRVKAEIKDMLAPITKRLEAIEARQERIEKLVEAFTIRCDSIDLRLETAAKALKK